MVSIYDKFKQVVAINNVYTQIIEDERKNLKNHFRDEEMIQDMITRKMLEENKFFEDEENLTKGIKYSPDYRKSTFN